MSRILVAAVVCLPSASVAFVVPLATQWVRPTIASLRGAAEGVDSFWATAPPLSSHEVYGGGLPSPSLQVAWRQDRDTVEVWAPLPEGCKVKRDCAVDFASKLSLSVSVSSPDGPSLVDIENGPLLHGVVVDDCSWSVEDEEVPGTEHDRWLCVRLSKKDKYLNWKSLFMGRVNQCPLHKSSSCPLPKHGDCAARSDAACPPPFFSGDDSEASDAKLSIGLGDAKQQKLITAYQLVAFQRVTQVVSGRAWDLAAQRVIFPLNEVKPRVKLELQTFLCRQLLFPGGLQQERRLPSR